MEPIGRIRFGAGAHPGPSMRALAVKSPPRSMRVDTRRRSGPLTWQRTAEVTYRSPPRSPMFELASRVARGGVASGDHLLSVWRIASTSSFVRRHRRTTAGVRRSLCQPVLGSRDPDPHRAAHTSSDAHRRARRRRSTPSSISRRPAGRPGPHTATARSPISARPRQSRSGERARAARSGGETTD